MKPIAQILYKDIRDEKIDINDVITECETPMANRYIFDLIEVLICCSVSPEVIDDILDYHFKHQYHGITKLSESPLCMENVYNIVNAIIKSDNDYPYLANWLFLECIQPFPFEFISPFEPIVTIKLNHDNAGFIDEEELAFVESAIIFNMVEYDFVEYVFNKFPRYNEKDIKERLIKLFNESPHYDDDERSIVIDMLTKAYNKKLLLNQ